MNNKFINFKVNLSDAEKKVIYSVADKIYLGSPGDSIFNFKLKKVKNAFKANCLINSCNGEFYAESLGSDPIESVSKLENKIYKKLNNWSVNRFKHLKTI